MVKSLLAQSLKDGAPPEFDMVEEAALLAEESEQPACAAALRHFALKHRSAMEAREAEAVRGGVGMDHLAATLEAHGDDMNSALLETRDTSADLPVPPEAGATPAASAAMAKLLAAAEEAQGDLSKVDLEDLQLGPDERGAMDYLMGDQDALAADNEAVLDRLLQQAGAGEADLDRIGEMSDEEFEELLKNAAREAPPGSDFPDFDPALIDSRLQDFDEADHRWEKRLEGMNPEELEAEDQPPRRKK
mmetsp:Transcript_22924/g.71241  ORF Transcript_22924/g.71241 Transcript_22924/m.71241 type:complete len:247 (-) Transcript_22924:90-830(-)